MNLECYVYFVALYIHRSGESALSCAGNLAFSDEDRSVGSKVPGVGELPVLNRLFGSQKDDSSRSEIVLSITPRLLRSIRRPELADAEFLSGTEANVGGRGPLAGDVAAAPATYAHGAQQASQAASQAQTPQLQAPIEPPAPQRPNPMTGGEEATGVFAQPSSSAKPEPVGPVPYSPKKGQ